MQCRGEHWGFGSCKNIWGWTALTLSYFCAAASIPYQTGPSMLPKDSLGEERWLIPGNFLIPAKKWKEEQLPNQRSCGGDCIPRVGHVVIRGWICTWTVAGEGLVSWSGAVGKGLGLAIRTTLTYWYLKYCIKQLSYLYCPKAELYIALKVQIPGSLFGLFYFRKRIHM